MRKVPIAPEVCSRPRAIPWLTASCSGFFRLRVCALPSCWGCQAPSTRPMPGSIACWRWASGRRARAFLRAHTGPGHCRLAGPFYRPRALTRDSCCWVSFAWSRCLLSWPGCCGPGGLPLAIFAAIFLMPFWVDIFHDYYLPDLLHAAILAAILLCLLFGHTASALLLLFPAYLARESTVLVAICLVFACWRRIRLRIAVIGVLAMLCAGLVSRHYGQAGPASVHGLSGGAYILGKLFWSFFKNVLGLPLWSNTLPECTPIWVTAIPPGHHLGAIRAVGLCQPSLWGPARLLLAWFGIFGIGPALALAVWRKMMCPPRSGSAGPGSHRLPLLYRVRAHQHPDDPAPRRQCRPPGGVWLAVLLCGAAVVSFCVL